MKLGIDIEPFAELKMICNKQFSGLSYYAVLFDLVGCDSLTVKIRSNRDFITNNDFNKLREIYKGYLILKIPLDEELIKFCKAYKPDAVIIYNEEYRKNTKENIGLNVEGKKDYLKDIKFRLSDSGISTYLNIEPNVKIVKEAHRIGVTGVEINTNKFVLASNDFQYSELLEEINLASIAANKLDLTVIANGNLNNDSIKSLAKIPTINELVIGRYLLSKASLLGVEKVINEIKSVLI